MRDFHALPYGRASAPDRTQAHLQEIHFLWRPFLHDADDDMILELALPGAAAIVTHQVKDFHGSDELGLTAVTLRDLLNLIRSK